MTHEALSPSADLVEPSSVPPSNKLKRCAILPTPVPYPHLGDYMLFNFVFGSRFNYFDLLVFFIVMKVWHGGHPVIAVTIGIVGLVVSIIGERIAKALGP